MKSIKGSDYFRRHFQNMFPHLTFRKISNLLLNVIELKLKIISPRSLPPYIKIEATPLCQLRCPGCTLSKKQFQSSMQITLEQFKRIVDDLSPTLLGISLSDNGEPLLHTDIVSLIEYAHSKNIAVSFPTNLSVNLNETSIERLVKSGLDSIFVSLDGATKETYNKYRVGGNFSLVLQNVRSLSEAKQRFGLRRPRIIWKFIIFDHNKHEVDIVRQKYRELGFDDYEFVPDIRDLSEESRKRYKASLRKKARGCFWLWHTMIIEWDGKVFPCCMKYNFDIGNAIEKGSKEIWRSEEYKLLRQGFSSKNNRSTMHPFCRKCLGYDAVDSTEAQSLSNRST